MEFAIFVALLAVLFTYLFIETKIMYYISIANLCVLIIYYTYIFSITPIKETNNENLNITNYGVLNLNIKQTNFLKKVECVIIDDKYYCEQK